MRLVGETAARGDLDGGAAGEQHLPRQPHSPVDHERMRCQAGFRFEDADEVSAREPGDAGQRFQVNILGEIRDQIVPGAGDARALGKRLAEFRRHQFGMTHQDTGHHRDHRLVGLEA